MAITERAAILTVLTKRLATGVEDAHPWAHASATRVLMGQAAVIVRPIAMAQRVKRSVIET